MMRLVATLVSLLMPMSLSAQEEEIVLGLSQAEVSITTNFDGSEILVYGAVKRDAPPPDIGPLGVVVTVSGPSVPVLVRRKEKKFGIWLNTDAVEVDRAPSYYAVVTSGPLNRVLTRVEDLRHKISIPRAIRSVGAPMHISNATLFTEALIRIRTRSDQYQVIEGGVKLDEDTLFRAAVRLPAALTEGDYAARIFLTRAGRVVARYDTVIDVRKVGLERWLFNLSRENALLYGLMSLVIAIGAGWGASAIFSMLRR
ncbi:TIGR02186 family protein [Sulfitobacter sp. G21635-S1]|uniref:TIGR02186 family protein n=1 Tax=Sulfitobacter sp. G21635-S1 TaxID=3014043 RepID=UPI0022AED2BF|nr:TIGR02186 family protein [Sulfitobacter sp. G21635-S1]MCZ4255100.1 TIGR02186 family protein [Sulfitobacter sp. G21635-S1]